MARTCREGGIEEDDKNDFKQKTQWKKDEKADIPPERCLDNVHDA